jgi:hypothetical protein
MLILASDAIHNFGAEFELRMAHAEAYGAALAFGTDKNNHKLKRHIRVLTRLAYPEVTEGGGGDGS